MASDEVGTGESSERIGKDRLEQTSAARRREDESGEGSTASKAAAPTRLDASRDFPYFEFYPYGYLY